MDVSHNYGLTVLYQPNRVPETSSEPLHTVFELVVFLPIGQLRDVSDWVLPAWWLFMDLMVTL